MPNVKEFHRKSYYAGTVGTWAVHAITNSEGNSHIEITDAIRSLYFSAEEAIQVADLLADAAIWLKMNHA